MNKPKKKKISPLVPVPIVVEDTPEPEEACHAPVPAPSPSPPPTAREEPEQDTRDVSGVDLLFYRSKQAEKNFIQVQRRWAKTGRTYLSTAHFFAEHPSELVRTHERLLEADKIHDEAKAIYILARRKFRLFQTLIKVSKTAKRNPQDLALQNVATRAKIRWMEFQTRRMMESVYGSNVTSMFDPTNYMEVVASKCGLAKAFGLVYLDQCEGLQVHD